MDASTWHQLELIGARAEEVPAAGASCQGCPGNEVREAEVSSSEAAPLLLGVQLPLQILKGAHGREQLLRKRDGDGGDGARGAAVDALRRPEAVVARALLHLRRDAQPHRHAVEPGEHCAQDVVHRAQSHNLHSAAVSACNPQSEHKLCRPHPSMTWPGDAT